MAKDTNKQNKKTFLEKLKYKYRLIVLNEDTFEQKASLRLSRMNMYVLGSAFFLLMVLIVTAIIALTPLKYYMPGVGSVDIRSQLLEMEMLTDSIENEMDKRNHWLGTFQKVISGELDSTFFVNDSIEKVHLEDHVDINEISDEEKNFKEEVKEEIELTKSIDKMSYNSTLDKSVQILKFVAPINGVVIDEFDKSNMHYGIDIASEENELVRSVESGTIISATWDAETGNVIVIQHPNNTISFYKHNSKLLKKVGSFVRKGETIAVVGNSGELSDGPHLHFELWQNGKAVDPLNYIDINKL